MIPFWSMAGTVSHMSVMLVEKMATTDTLLGALEGTTKKKINAYFIAKLIEFTSFWGHGCNHVTVRACPCTRVSTDRDIITRKFF